MGITQIDPEGIAPPVARFTHGVLAGGVERILHTSGMLPILPDGSVPQNLTAQAEAVWSNVLAVLVDAGMAITNVVSITTYVVPGQDLATIMSVRDQALEGHLAASTLVVVPELAQPAWLVEVTVVAVA
ncbi:MAG: RidA family protein [Acidimicrobiales bacterium]|nr:RidA family protein [Acidimicrobiales bacterium]